MADERRRHARASILARRVRFGNDMYRSVSLRWKVGIAWRREPIARRDSMACRLCDRTGRRHPRCLRASPRLRGMRRSPPCGHAFAETVAHRSDDVLYKMCAEPSKARQFRARRPVTVAFNVIAGLSPRRLRTTSISSNAQPSASARSGTRTRTPLRERDFKSLASTGFAIPATSERASRDTERHVVKSRAGNGTRTRDPNLGKVVLYQLSYSRATRNICKACRSIQTAHARTTAARRVR